MMSRFHIVFMIYNWRDNWPVRYRVNSQLYQLSLVQSLITTREDKFQYKFMIG